MKGKHSHWIIISAAIAAAAGGIWWYETHASGHGGNVTVTSAGVINSPATPTGFVAVTLPVGGTFNNVAYQSPGGPQTPVALSAVSTWEGAPVLSNIGATKGTVATIVWTPNGGAAQTTTITFT